ncbi:MULTISPECIES: hypothetical protein [Rhizobium]|uniref:Uncharacterized protein n=1 Tax=Rhizobium tropici TaxID=398 RepID=A0A329YF81_RHITR|nr:MULTISPECIES: hypothetical protein [Rhizobium]MBB3286761.1 hypothetical protein [Rhizobium sp. BK252]MBB3401045.1 hypothetical protein [Rhizobium sp. BK289]MBB3413623.1 hypothetical protein [Rhizobium sp. BK284]MBB3481510.1 hypothetical protein [Rhizobium sp. BK347]MDK4719895.1 hypothetical protein [Rhizobium sp. CNPSo 3968]
MRPFRLATAIAMSCLAIGHAHAGDSKGFRLTIDGVVVGINPGDTFEVTMRDGRKVPVELQRSDTVTFTGGKFSFDHDGKLTVAKTDLGDGVQQYALMTPIGTGIIVQVYKGLDPSGNTDVVLQQMVQESLNGGAKITKQSTQRTLPSGNVLKGVKAETITDDDVMEYEIVATGRPEGGILVATFLNKENLDKEGGILDKLWSTLKVDY